MKYKQGKEIYLQSYVVGFILNELDEVPLAIFNEIFEDARTSVLFLAKDSFNFIKFESRASIKWIEGQDWILDFNEYKDKSVSELQSLYKKWYEKYNADIDEFNAKDETYRLEHYKEITDKIQKEEMKISELSSLIYYVEHNYEWPQPK